MHKIAAKRTGVRMASPRRGGSLFRYNYLSGFGFWVKA
jgi:hypothetical protein